MSRPKLIIAYLCLVGGPLLGLLGILRAGRYLTPPLAVGGTWNLEADFAALANASCRELFANVNQPFFSVSQSGPNLTFSLNNAQGTILPGIIKDATLTAGAALHPSSADGGLNCGDPGALRLQATLSKHGEQRVLSGNSHLNGCTTCASIPFHAVRRITSRGENE